MRIMQVPKKIWKWPPPQTIARKIQLYQLTDMLLLVGGSFTQTIKAGLVSFMVTMTKVESCNRQTLVDQVLKGWNIPTGRSQGTNNLRLTVRRIGLSQDRFKGDVGSTKFWSADFGLRLHVWKVVVVVVVVIKMEKRVNKVLVTMKLWEVCVEKEKGIFSAVSFGWANLFPFWWLTEHGSPSCVFSSSRRTKPRRFLLLFDLLKSDVSY